MKIALGILLFIIVVYIACIFLEDGDFKDASSLLILVILAILLICGMLILLYLGACLILGGLW